MTDQTLQTEFNFTLPKGYVDDDGTVHREGRMRLATAADEIKPLNDPRVQENGSYLTILLLSRVVVELGSLSEVTPEVIESLFVPDLAHLQQLYEEINAGELASVGPTGELPDPASAVEDTSGPIQTAETDDVGEPFETEGGLETEEGNGMDY